jgi:dTDP-4-amino-4,6-dideoxygalactose transaminase
MATQPCSSGYEVSVPYFDLKDQYSDLRDEILAALDRVCRNSSFVLGEEVEEFEKAFAAYCETRHCVAVNSGTSALHLALLSVGVRPGDEVITTPNTFIATVEAVSYTGAKPVFVDINPLTANIDATKIEAAISDRTKAIVPVHLYGRPAALDAILMIAERHQLAVIEDACQAHGARYHQKRVGSLGRAAAFSFYPGKNLAAYGEGGALTTNSDQVAQFARAMRDHGQSSRYLHDYIGYNYRMDGFQGAVLRIKLKRLEQWNAKRRQLARLYRDLLTDARLSCSLDDPDAEPVYHLFVVYVDDRDRVRSELEACGVHTAVHYPRPVHLQGCYAALGYGRGSFPHAECACDRAISLPLFPEMTPEQVNYAATTLLRIVGRRAPKVWGRITRVGAR